MRLLRGRNVDSERNPSRPVEVTVEDVLEDLDVIAKRLERIEEWALLQQREHDRMQLKEREEDS